MKAFISAVVALIALGISTYANAQCPRVSSELELAWDPSTSPDVTDVLLFGTSSGSGTQDFAAPPFAVVPVPGTTYVYLSGSALSDVTYHFVLMARNSAGDVSVNPSNEICFVLDQTAPFPPTNFRIVTITITVDARIDAEPVVANK